MRFLAAPEYKREHRIILCTEGSLVIGESSATILGTDRLYDIEPRPRDEQYESHHAHYQYPCDHESNNTSSAHSSARIFRWIASQPSREPKDGKEVVFPEIAFVEEGQEKARHHQCPFENSAKQSHTAAGTKDAIQVERLITRGPKVTVEENTIAILFRDTEEIQDQMGHADPEKPRSQT